MTAFDDAMADLFADPNMSRPVLYRVGGAGAGVQINVIWSERLREMDFASTGAVVKDTVADVRLVDIAAPAVGDTLEPLDSPGQIYGVAAKPLRDSQNLISTVTLKLAS